MPSAAIDRTAMRGLLDGMAAPIRPLAGNPALAGTMAIRATRAVMHLGASNRFSPWAEDRWGEQDPQRNPRLADWGRPAEEPPAAVVPQPYHLRHRHPGRPAQPEGAGLRHLGDKALLADVWVDNETVPAAKLAERWPKDTYRYLSYARAP
jgi:hypothetical protein